MPWRMLITSSPLILTCKKGNYENFGFLLDPSFNCISTVNNQNQHMGYYINEDSKGKVLPKKGKYEALIKDGGVPHDGKDFAPDLVCVVDNGSYEGAGYAYSSEEFEFMKRPDSFPKQRPRRWLTYKPAITLSGFYQNAQK